MHIINFEKVLQQSKHDDKAGINIAELTNDEEFSMHITEIPPLGKVNAHYHKDGIEIYQILSGQGTLYTASVHNECLTSSVNINEVSAGDFFSIPPKTAHQLCNNGTQPLKLIFGCPKTHLKNDRHIVDQLF